MTRPWRGRTRFCLHCTCRHFLCYSVPVETESRWMRSARQWDPMSSHVQCVFSCQCWMRSWVVSPCEPTDVAWLSTGSDEVPIELLRETLPSALWCVRVMCPTSRDPAPLIPSCPTLFQPCPTTLCLVLFGFVPQAPSPPHINSHSWIHQP